MSDLDNLRLDVAQALGWCAFSGNNFGKLFGADPTGERRPLPDWPNDVNAALALWDTVPDDWTPRLVRMIVPRGVLTFGYKGAFLHNETHEQIEYEAPTPAEAITRAWLAWKQEQEG
jgi:hypothetical protein